MEEANLFLAPLLEANDDQRLQHGGEDERRREPKPNVDGLEHTSAIFAS